MRLYSSGFAISLALVLFAGCGDDGTPPATDTGTDGGTIDTGTMDGGTMDTGTMDAGGDTGTDASTPSCTDGITNGNETDVDCGGTDCTSCVDGAMCSAATDCVSGVCDGTCSAPTCSDGAANGNETDVDCGGPDCGACGNGAMCTAGTDCTSSVCDPTSSLCVAAGCIDMILNGTETDVDCGGADCSPCADGLMCAAATDCTSSICDGTSNTCTAPLCTDTVMNGNETDVDCGGADCTTCADGLMCTAGTDCASGVCAVGTSLCAAPSCTDTVMNGNETGVDCGGSDCGPCPDGGGCTAASDCASGVCDGATSTCSAATCTDTVMNGTETDVDCGGSACGGCAGGEMCSVDGDCASGLCASGSCEYPVDCVDVMLRAGGTTDGIYTIDPDGAGAIAPVDVYCDQSTDGGGWMLAGRSLTGAGTGCGGSGVAGSNFGWGSGTGLVSDDAAAYSLDVVSNGLTGFEQILFGSYDTGKTWGDNVYRHTGIDDNGAADYIAGYPTSAYLHGAADTIIGSCDGGPDMFNYLGFTDDPDGFHFRDNLGPQWGLASNGWHACYNDCARGGMLNAEAGMVMVRHSACADGVQNRGETDVDCGGAFCGRCDVADSCGSDSDCLSGSCTAGTCAGNFASCSHLQLAEPTAPDGQYMVDLDGGGPDAPMLAQCDMTTDGGGWTLVLNYLHRGGTNPVLDPNTATLPVEGGRTLGTDESTSADNWGHAAPALLSNITFDETMWWARSSAHNRVIHFKTDSATGTGTGDYLRTGAGNMRMVYNPANTTNLSGRVEATLPLHATTERNGYLSQGTLAMTAFPFYSATSLTVDNGRAHWGIRGLGSRWEVDDAGGNANTHHQIWVRVNPRGDGMLSGGETDVDCGGPAPGCIGGETCGADGDCASGNCSAGSCDDTSYEASCDDLLGASPSIPDGIYRIDVDGAGIIAPQLAYCDMTTDGGGWTMVVSTAYNSGLGAATIGEVLPGTISAMPDAVRLVLATGATQVHLRTADTQAIRSATSAAGTQPITNLVNGQPLVQWTPASTDYDLTDWSGPHATDALLGNITCTNTSASYPATYWACGNNVGLHLLSVSSRWRFGTGGAALNEPLELYVR